MVTLSLFFVAAQAAMAVDFDRATASSREILEGLRPSAASMADAPMTPAPAASTEFPALPSNTPPKQVKIFRDAFAKAIIKLQNPKCAAFYGAPGEGERRFRAVAYKYEPLGRPTFDESGNPMVVGAATIAGTPVQVFMNSEGPFVNQNVWAHGRWTALDFETNLRGADFGGLLLLHELGHVVGKFGPDADDSKLNRSYTDAVIKNCYR
ncbi:MAG: hypothetical protein ACHQ49_00390 [Elusimicrobiota bacterium]